MELVAYIFAVATAGSFYYLVLCSLYFALTSRSQRTALKLCWKLALVSIVGIPLAGFGGAVLAVLILHGELHKADNYSQVRDILASIVISVACSVAIYVTLIALAFSIFD